MMFYFSGAGMDDALYVATRDPPGLRRCSLGEEYENYAGQGGRPELTLLEDMNFIQNTDGKYMNVMFLIEYLL
jgi:hypothetical protein